MNTPSMDPVSALVMLAVMLMGPQLAPFIGIYAVVVLSSGVGAVWALSRSPKKTKTKAALFMLRINLTAVFLTWPLAHFAQAQLALPDFQWWFPAVGLLVGVVGDDLVPLFRAVGAKFGIVLPSSGETK